MNKDIKNNKSAMQKETDEELLARALVVANNKLKAMAKREDKLEQVNDGENDYIDGPEDIDDLIADSEDVGQRLCVGQAARLLDLPFDTKSIIVELRKRGVFLSDRDEPKQKYINRKLFEVTRELLEFKHCNSVTVVSVLVTQSGLRFLKRLFEKQPQTKESDKQ